MPVLFLGSASIFLEASMGPANRSLRLEVDANGCHTTARMLANGSDVVADPAPQRRFEPGCCCWSDSVKSHVFTMVVEKDVIGNSKKAYHSHCPVLKGCHSWGHTYDEALGNVREAVELYLEDLRKSEEPIPVDPGGCC